MPLSKEQKNEVSVTSKVGSMSCVSEIGSTWHRLPFLNHSNRSELSLLFVCFASLKTWVTWEVQHLIARLLHSFWIPIYCVSRVFLCFSPFFCLLPFPKVGQCILRLKVPSLHKCFIHPFLRRHFNSFSCVNTQHYAQGCWWKQDEFLYLPAQNQRI